MDANQCLCGCFLSSNVARLQSVHAAWTGKVPRATVEGYGPSARSIAAADSAPSEGSVVRSGHSKWIARALLRSASIFEDSNPL